MQNNQVYSQTTTPETSSASSSAASSDISFLAAKILADGIIAEATDLFELVADWYPNIAGKSTTPADKSGRTTRAQTEAMDRQSRFDKMASEWTRDAADPFDSLSRVLLAYCKKLEENTARLQGAVAAEAESDTRLRVRENVLLAQFILDLWQALMNVYGTGKAGLR